MGALVLLTLHYFYITWIRLLSNVTYMFSIYKYLFEDILGMWGCLMKIRTPLEKWGHIRKWGYFENVRTKWGHFQKGKTFSVMKTIWKVRTFFGHFLEKWGLWNFKIMSTFRKVRIFWRQWGQCGHFGKWRHCLECGYFWKMRTFCPVLMS